jgi:hypothetical protein
VRQYVFDYYVHKRDMEELARRNEERRIQLQAQQEREERERIAEEERQHEVRKKLNDGRKFNGICANFPSWVQ